MYSPQRSVAEVRPPDAHGRVREEWREEAEPRDVVEVHVREQDVDLGRQVRHQRVPEQAGFRCRRRAR